MTEAFSHVLPLDEDEYLAMGESPGRMELFDGSLLLSPAPGPRHQLISLRLAMLLAPAAVAVGLQVLEAVNVRLKRGRLPIPDLVVVGAINFDEQVVESAAVRLICEVVLPGNPANDRVLKMHYYAEAGIPWYLLVEQDPVLTLRLYGLEGGKYVERATGEPGAPLRLTDPVRVDIDPRSPMAIPPKKLPR